MSWSHCEGKHNPADLLTRGLSVEGLWSNELWWHGAPHLLNEECDWKKVSVQPSPEDAEYIQAEICVTDDATTLKVSCAVDNILLLDITKHSSFSRVIRTTAWILRFVRNTQKTTLKACGPLSNAELLTAEKYWIRTTQRGIFSAEIAALESRQKIDQKSKLRNFQNFLDDEGLLCLRSRLTESTMAEREINPWILPSNHKFTELLIKSCHEQLQHSGVGATLAHIREKYWIVTGRQTVKKILGRCLVCHRMRARPVSEIVANLPRDRVTEGPPFETTGLDFAGPLYVKSGPDVRKVYILILTCAVTRAVHLELVEGQTTNNFILALKRFISRRGLCKTIYSDNSKTFQKADKELGLLWKNLKIEELIEKFGNQGVEWKFNVPKGAWWGGMWERLIRTIKACLRKSLGRACLNYAEMETTLTEIEAIMNSRPLTYAHNEPEEEAPLTPAHFLIGQRIATLPPRKIGTDHSNLKLTSKDLNRRMKYREQLLNSFWRRWRKEYLLDLRTVHFRDTKSSNELKIGDLVLVYDEKLPRHLWKMGRVNEIFIGRDNRARSCAIRLPKGTIIRRPVQLLYPLELKEE